MAVPANLLRDYQQDIVSRVRAAWTECRSVMVQMPTGTGKTHVLAGIVGDFLPAGRVLIVAHRIELVAQIGETLERFGYGEGVRVASIQTVARRPDVPGFIPDLVVIDEAHHALAKTYRVLWERWPQARFLGLTATPCRMNRVGFTDLFDRLVCSYGIAEFIRRGVLSSFDYLTILPDSADRRLVDSLEKRGADGDYQVKEMERVLNHRSGIARLYGSMMRYAAGRKGIVYAVSIAHARSIADYYSSRGVSAAAIDSRTPCEERKQLVSDFRSGILRVLVNVDVFSEGFDCPDVEFVQMARPTLSLAKYLQQVGRGLRRSRGKRSCVLIDNVGLYGTFGLPVVAWDWERMFRGEQCGKGSCVPSALPVTASAGDGDMGLVISSDALLSGLSEAAVSPLSCQRPAVLKAWQDDATGLWGLRRGSLRTTVAEYVTVFGIRDDWAAVRFRNYTCGLVDGTGSVLWRQGQCLSLEFVGHRLLLVKDASHRCRYLDLCNLQLYDGKPEAVRFGKFELLKLDGIYYSRTRRVYSSRVGTVPLICDEGSLLLLHQYPFPSYCLLEDDSDGYYELFRRLPDGSLLVSDLSGVFYRIAPDGTRTLLEEQVKKTP